MPAFLAHFHILEIAADAVAKDYMKKFLGADYKQFVYRPPNRQGQKLSQFAYFGSVAPDLPYYAEDNKLKWLADLFHLKKSGSMAANLLDCIRNLRSGSKRDYASGSLYLLPFVLGYLCHIAGDIMVHPYVNCYAGEYEHQKKHKKVDESWIPGEGNVPMEMHQFVELHQDIYLAKTKYGSPKLSDGPGDKTLTSWSDFIQDLKGIEQLDGILREMADAVNKTFGKPVTAADLNTAEGRMHDSLDVGYDTAAANIPDNMVDAFVHHKYVLLDFMNLIGAAAWVMAKVFWPAAITYLNSNGTATDRLKFIDVIGQFNLDTGYELRAYSSDNIIHVRYVHSWARFLVAPTTPPKENTIETGKGEKSKDDSISVEYPIVQGDTLSKIAARHGMTWPELYSYDGGTGIANSERLRSGNPDLIYPDEVIRVPT